MRPGRDSGYGAPPVPRKLLCLRTKSPGSPRGRSLPSATLDRNFLPAVRRDWLTCYRVIRNLTIAPKKKTTLRQPKGGFSAFRTQILMLISLLLRRFLGGCGGSSGFWFPELRICLNPLVRRVAHARIKGEQVRLARLNRRGRQLR